MDRDEKTIKKQRQDMVREVVSKASGVLTGPSRMRFEYNSQVFSDMQ